MFERCVYFNVHVLARKLNRRWEDGFARFGLSPSHGYLLRLILQKPGLSQQAIAAELCLEKSTVVRFLNQLEREGYLTRRGTKDDRRCNEIHPTAKALALRADFEALGEALYAEMCEIAGKEKLAALVVSLRTLAGRM